MWGFSPAWRATALAALAADAVSPSADDPARTNEWTLWRRFQLTRNEAVRQDLTARYAPLARILAARQYGVRSDAGLEFADYHHFALVGLLECIDRFEPAHGVRFETYASAYMQGTIADGVASLSERQRQASARRQLLRERTRSLADPAAHPDHASALARVTDLAIGLALGFMLEDSGMFLNQHAEPAMVDATYHGAELRRLNTLLGDSLAQLPPPQRRVLRLHYLQGQTLTDIAQALDLTKGRISQLHRAGLATLAQWLRDRGVTGSENG